MVMSNPRSFTRSGGLFGSSSMVQSCILLDAALERCGNAPSSEIDATAAASQAACCDFELAKLAQACWTCSQPESTHEACDTATSTADIALGMSTCGAPSSMSALLSSSAQLQPPHINSQHLRLQQRSPLHAFVTRGGGDEEYTGPSTVFLVAFFCVISLLAIAVAALIIHRCRKAQPYRKRAHRRAVLDLMEGFTPVDEKPRSDSPDPQNPWVQFQPDHDVVSPPPMARSRTPSPTPEDMYEIPSNGLGSPRPSVRPVPHGRIVPQLVFTPPPRYENGATVLASPMAEPVPIRRY